MAVTTCAAVAQTYVISVEWSIVTVMHNAAVIGMRGYCWLRSSAPGRKPWPAGESAHHEFHADRLVADQLIDQSIGRSSSSSFHSSIFRLLCLCVDKHPIRTSYTGAYNPNPCWSATVLGSSFTADRLWYIAVHYDLDLVPVEPLAWQCILAQAGAQQLVLPCCYQRM